MSTPADKAAPGSPDDGHVVLSYSTRGLWLPQAGFNDKQAPKTWTTRAALVIDCLIANAPVDPSRIGSAGIS